MRLSLMTLAMISKNKIRNILATNQNILNKILNFFGSTFFEATLEGLVNVWIFLILRI